MGSLNWDAIEASPAVGFSALITWRVADKAGLRASGGSQERVQKAVVYAVGVLYLPQVDAAARYLDAYDHQLRTAWTGAASTAARLGPLHLLTLERGQGFVTYQDLHSVTDKSIPSLVSAALDHFRRDETIERVDWKTCSHDHAPGLSDALFGSGFTVDAKESVMVGATVALAAETPLPPGVTLRQVTERDDVAAMEEMQGAIFGDADWPRRVEVMMRLLAADDGMQMWVAEFRGEIVTAGRIEPVAETDFADLCGGATRPEWRGRGVYRALTAARARAALALGKTLLHSSSTEHSRPVLERAGLLHISTSTTYRWHRANGTGEAPTP